ncbi:transmembrane protein 132C dtn isoform X3 [Dermatophagoides farinae]|uniref:transmembrane protein 132C dtn isoform X3 n=1 Tax=Dermatophagoides farinae TaxID=6954 RepID=UPI003F5DF0D7
MKIICYVIHFALTDSTSSVTLYATYGPFMAKKTINPFSVCRNDSSSSSTTTKWTTSVDCQRKLSSTITDGGGGDKKNNLNHNYNNYISEQINAYLVTKEVRRSHPVLRVLFYASHLFELRSNHNNFVTRPSSNNNNVDRNEKSICAVVIVQYHGERLFGTCSPSSSQKNRLNACLAEIIIPALYWPPLDVTNGGNIYAAKQQKSSIAKVFYTITHIPGDQQCNDQNFLSLLASQSPNSNDNDGDDDESISDLFSAENSMNLIHLSDVFLVPFRGSYEEVTNDNVVTVLIPQEPVHPNSKIYIPVKYTYNPEYPVSAFSLRVQVKPGLRILGAQLSHPNKLWQLSIELGTGQTSATVTAFLRDSSLDSQSLLDELMENISQEVYSWLIEITDEVNIAEMNGRIVWQLLYETETDSYRNPNTNIIDASIEQHFASHRGGQFLKQEPNFEKESIKLTSLIDIQKDVMEEIIAITNSKELLNTAILNGRQVSRTMRIYQVSAAGHISDITFQCSCQSIDESILKVSTSCTSVYLDGSEIRGSQNATILIRYGSFIGQGNFVVWMPQIPLEVRVSDDKLSQIKKWRVHRPINRIGSMNSNLPNHGSSSINENHFDTIDDEMLADQNDNDDGYWPELINIPNSIQPQICQLKFQQTRIEVYTRYMSSDHDSGREASLVNRRHSIRITKIVQNMIRVSDKKILRILRANIIEGVSAGTANVEIISPITGAIIGSKQIEVNMERESITNMKVHLISGIQMEIEPVGQLNQNIWMVRTSLINSLTKQYQEALLEARLFFSDQTSTYLSEISPNDYHLTINTFKGVVDNVTRDNVMQNRGEEIGTFIYEIPRIIALMPGQGESIHMTIDSMHSCHEQKKNSQQQQQQPLSSSFINVDVNFESPNSMFSLQNDAIHYRRFGGNGAVAKGITRHDLSSSIINQTGKSNEFFNNPYYNNKNKRIPIASTKKHHHNHNDNIRFQRHSIAISTSSLNHDENGSSSIKFGILSFITIVGIAFIIVVIYSVFIAHFRQNHQITTATTTVTQTTASNSIQSQSSTKGKGITDLKPYLSACLNRSGSSNHQIDSNVHDWIWISKEELENEQKIIKNPMEQAKLLTPLLHHHHHHDHHNNGDQLKLSKKFSSKNQTSSPAALRLSNSAHSNDENESDDNHNAMINITINPSETFFKHKQIGHQNDDDDDVAGDSIIRKFNFPVPGTIEAWNDSNSNNNNKVIAAMPPLSEPLLTKTRHIPIPKQRVNNSNKNHHHNNRNRRNEQTNELVPKRNSSTSSSATPPPLPLHRRISESNKRLKISSSYNDNDIDEIPPPIPPHRNIDNNSAIMKTPTTTTTILERPKQLLLQNVNSINNSQRQSPREQQIDYHFMMKILNDRLKESQA